MIELNAWNRIGFKEGEREISFHNFWVDKSAFCRGIAGLILLPSDGIMMVVHAGRLHVIIFYLFFNTVFCFDSIHLFN